MIIIYIEDVLLKLKTDPDMILDVGCGRGETTYLLKQRFRRKKVLSLDMEKLVLEYMRDKGLNENVIRGRGTALPIKTESVDLLVCDQVIEHIVEENELIAEIVRVVKPGGYIIVGSVMRKRFVISIYKGRNGKFALSPDHVREYENKDEFIVWFKDHFKIHDISLYPVRFSLIITVMRFLAMFGLVKDVPSISRYLVARHQFLASLVIPRIGFNFIYLIGQKIDRRNKVSKIIF